MRIKLFPHIGVLFDDLLIDSREIIRINLKVMAVFFEHRHFVFFLSQNSLSTSAEVLLLFRVILSRSRVNPVVIKSEKFTASPLRSFFI